MKKNFYLVLFSLLFSCIFWACKDYEPDLDPDFEVHTATISYHSTSEITLLYGPFGNTEGVGIKNSYNNNPLYLINCELIGTGTIGEATDDLIVVNQTTKLNSNQLNGLEIRPEMGFIFKGDLIYTTYGDNKETKTFYFYAYFTDFVSSPNIEFYNPGVIHYQRFK